MQVLRLLFHVLDYDPLQLLGIDICGQTETGGFTINHAGIIHHGSHIAKTKITALLAIVEQIVAGNEYTVDIRLAHQRQN